MTQHGLYVQFGAHHSCPDGWLNFDVTPVLRLQRLPVVGTWIVRKQYRFPPKVRYGNIIKGLPVSSASADGVYASHVLEHLSLEDFRTALRKTFGMLKPNGVFRCVVPDLAERAHRYVEALSRGNVNASIEFIKGCSLGKVHRPYGLEGSLRALFGNSAHLWMWDELSLVHELRKAGFADVRRCEFGDANDPAFAQVEDRARFVDESFSPAIRELAVEARRPMEQ